MPRAEHLFIDGWNIIHAWEHLRPHGAGELAVAADRLLAEVRVLHDLEGLITTCVFDARGPRLQIERVELTPGLTRLHAPAGFTADAIIEQCIAAVSNPEDCLVATRDRALQQAVFAMGARTLSPEDLAERVSAAHSRQRRQLSNHTKNIDQTFRNGIFDALDRS